MSCPCGLDHSTDAPGSVYFVSCIDGPRRALIAGPYPTHAQALQDVEDARKAAEEADPRAAFYAFGTARADGDPFASRPGVLNEKLAQVKARGVAVLTTV